MEKTRAFQRIAVSRAWMRRFSEEYEQRSYRLSLMNRELFERWYGKWKVEQAQDMMTPGFQSKNIRKRHPKSEERIMNPATMAHTVFICALTIIRASLFPWCFDFLLHHSLYAMCNIHCVGVDPLVCLHVGYYRSRAHSVSVTFMKTLGIVSMVSRSWLLLAEII